MPAAKWGVGRNHGLRGLISSRFEYFLAFFVVCLSIILIVVALIVPIIQPSLSQPVQPVIQGMTAIVSAVIGYYFGNRGVERAEERVREVESQLATGLGPLGIQRERIDSELREIHEKMKNTIDQANRASELHGDNRKKEAELFFRNAEEYNKQSCNGMNAWLKASHAWLKLDEDSPNYEDILVMFNESKKYREQADIPTGIHRKLTDFGIAIASIWTNQEPNKPRRKEEAISLLNGIANDIAKMKDLYYGLEYPDLRERDVDKFLNEMKDEIEKGKLDKKVVKYLKEAESYYNKNK